MAQPTRKCRAGARSMARCNIDKPRRPGAAIKIFIGTPNRKIGPTGGQINLCCAGTMGQIPQGQGTLCMGFCRQPCHIMHPATAVIDLGDKGHCDLISDMVLNLFWIHDTQLVVAVQRGNQPLSHVKIRGKIAAVR